MPQNDFKLIRVLSALVCEPWLLSSEMHKTLTEIVLAHARGGSEEADQHSIAAAMEKAKGNRMFTVMGHTAMIPVEGVIGRKFSDCLQSSGVVSVDVLNRILQSAADDEQIDSICMVFDSPGGVAMGVPETSSLISKINEKKPVVAYADGLMCSAAYWMAAQCCAIYAMPSAQVGSIGAYMAVLDQSRSLEMDGLRVEMFKSGKHKGMGYPGTALNDEQRKMLQVKIDALGADFRASVRAGRGKEISDDVMQGQSFSADEAKRLGLIDSIADFTETLRDVAVIGKSRARRKQQA